MFVMCNSAFCMCRFVFWACLSRCVWGPSCWGSFSLPCCLTCACNGNWGRWKGFARHASSYHHCNVVNTTTNTHTHTNNYWGKEFTFQIEPMSLNGTPSETPSSFSCIINLSLIFWHLKMLLKAHQFHVFTSSCGWFMSSKGWIQKYNVDRKVVGPLGSAGAHKKRWPQTQQIAPRSWRSVSSAPPETTTFSCIYFFWSPRLPF